MYAILAATVLVGAVAFLIEERVYATTGSRAAEGSIAFALVFPTSIFAAWASGRLLRGRQNSYRRTSLSFGVMAFTFFLFLANQIVAIFLPERHQYPELLWLHEANVALRFIIIFLFPAYLFMMLKYLRTTSNDAQRASSP